MYRDMREGVETALSALIEAFESEPDELWTGREVADAIRLGLRNASSILGEFDADA